MKDQESTTGSSAAVWDRAAACYDKDRSQDPVYASCIDQVARHVPSGTRYCLDAGCGTGLSTLAVAPKCNTVVAVDYSHESLVELRKKSAPNVFLVQADITALPFRDSFFDATASSNILQHLKPDGPQQRAIQELSRAPSGRIVGTT